MTQQVAAGDDNRHGGIAAFIKSNIREYGLLMSLIVIMVFFQVATNGALFKPLNLTNIVLQNSYIVIMALGMLLVIVTGHIDLSVGSVAGFIGAVVAVLMVQHQVNFVVAAGLCLILGGVIGAAQGYFIAYQKIPSFIVTLAGMLVFKGLALYILDGKSVGPFPPQFQLLSSGFIPNFAPGFHTVSMLIGLIVTVIVIYFNLKDRKNQQAHGLVEEPMVFFLGRNLLVAIGFILFSYLLASYKGLPNVLIIMFALISLYAFVTSSTTIGRRIYALGGNEKAARLSGIKTERLTFYTFVNMGVLAALAGLIFAARLNTATPKAGLGFELDVIAAVFIGGASASGGVGKVIGAVIGAFIMGVMNNGMSILGIGIDLQQVIKGLVLLAAVFLDVYYKKKA